MLEVRSKAYQEGQLARSRADYLKGRRDELASILALVEYRRDVTAYFFLYKWAVVEARTGPLSDYVDTINLGLQYRVYSMIYDDLKKQEKHK